jgi:hypothetical protein
MAVRPACREGRLPDRMTRLMLFLAHRMDYPPAGIRVRRGATAAMIRAIGAAAPSTTSRCLVISSASATGMHSAAWTRKT